MIKEVREVSNADEVNKLLSKGWVMLDTFVKDKLVYVMALYEKKDCEPKQGCGPSISKGEYEMTVLKELCKPVVNYLKRNWDPHCTVVITDNHIKLVRDEIGIPVGTAQEVPVQEQPTKTLEFVNKELGISLTQEQYDKIAIRDCCVSEYRAEEILRLLKALNLI